MLVLASLLSAVLSDPAPPMQEPVVVRPTRVPTQEALERSCRSAGLVGEYGAEPHLVEDQNGDGVPDLCVYESARYPQVVDECRVFSARRGSAVRRFPVLALSSRVDATFWTDPDANLDTPPYLLPSEAMHTATPLVWNSTVVHDTGGACVEVRHAERKGRVVALAGRVVGSWFRANVTIDFDRDGRPDLLVSSRAFSESIDVLDAVAILSGRDGRVLWELPAEIDTRWSPVEVQPLEDLDCDGTSDVAISRRFVGGERGDVRTVSGRDGSVLSRLFDATTCPVDSLDLFHLCDLDGDSVGELGLGQFGHFARVVSPVTGAELFVETTTGREADDCDGFACSMVAFRDGQGRPKVLIGVNNSRVFSGTVECWDLTKHERLYTSGYDDVWHLGTDIGILGDVDDDGTPDFYATTDHSICGEPEQVFAFSGATGARLWRAYR